MWLGSAKKGISGYLVRISTANCQPGRLRYWIFSLVEKPR